MELVLDGDTRRNRGMRICHEAGVAACTQRGKFELGEAVEALLPDGTVVPFAPAWLRDAEGQPITGTPHAMMAFTLPVPRPLPPGSILRKKK